MDKCAKLQVKAVIVKENQVIAEGENTPMRPCDDVTCHVDGRCVSTLHAEQSALLKAGKGADGATLFTNFEPCHNCRKMIMASGISTVVYNNRKYDELNHRFKGNVEWIHEPLELDDHGMEIRRNYF